MKRILTLLVLLVLWLMSVPALAQTWGSLRPICSLGGTTDSNGALIAYGTVYSGTQGPLTIISNLRGRTDSNGALNITLAGGAITPDSARFPASEYINWGATAGTTGYGIRDNAGTIEFKNSGGAWTNVATASNYLARTGTVLSPATAGDTLAMRGIQIANVADQTAMVGSIAFGDGGANSTAATGVGINPVDPLEFEANGSYNGTRNTFVGIGAGLANTGGNGNTFAGYSSGLSNTNGDQNGFYGWFSGRKNTSGYHNAFLGAGAGEGNTTGSYNTYVGTDSGSNSNAVGTGDYNVAISPSAGWSLGSGHGNTFTGYGSGHSAVAGSENVFAGLLSGWNATGNYSTAVGAYSAFSQTTGTNAAVGFQALYTNSTGTNNLALGTQAGKYWTGSNKVYIDGLDRTNTAGDDAGALVVGVLNATPASQTLRLNAIVSTLGTMATAGYLVGATAGIDKTCGGPVISSRHDKGILTAMTCTSEPDANPLALLAMVRQQATEIAALQADVASLRAELGLLKARQ